MKKWLVWAINKLLKFHGKINLIIFIFQQISNKRIISKLIKSFETSSNFNVTFNCTENVQKKNDKYH